MASGPVLGIWPRGSGLPKPLSPRGCVRYGSIRVRRAPAQARTLDSPDASSDRPEGEQPARRHAGGPPPRGTSARRVNFLNTVAAHRLTRDFPLSSRAKWLR